MGVVQINFEERIHFFHFQKHSLSPGEHVPSTSSMNWGFSHVWTVQNVYPQVSVVAGTFPVWHGTDAQGNGAHTPVLQLGE